MVPHPETKGQGGVHASDDGELAEQVGLRLCGGFLFIQRHDLGIGQGLAEPL